jgi:hypothetical protein
MFGCGLFWRLFHPQLFNLEGATAIEDGLMAVSALANREFCVFCFTGAVYLLEVLLVSPCCTRRWNQVLDVLGRPAPDFAEISQGARQLQRAPPFSLL